jgi:iron complex outermembrane recepter protein
VRRQTIAGPLRGDALAAAGQDGVLRLGLAAGGSLAPALTSVVSLSHARSDGPADAQSSRFNHLVGGLSWQVSDALALFAQVDWLDTSVDNAYWGTPLVNGQPVPSLARRNYNLAPDNRYDDQVLWLTAGVQGSTATTKYKAQVYRYDADRDWKNLYAFSTTNVPGRVQPRAVENLGYEHELTGARGELRFDLVGTRTLVGFDAQRTDFNSPRSTSTNRPDFDPRVPQPVSFDAFALPRADARRAEVHSQALFAENRWPFAAQWALVSALRVNVAFDRDFSWTDGRLGIVHDLSSEHSLYASASGGREPIESLLIYDPSQQGFDLTTYTGYELGARSDWLSGRMKTEVALYRLQRRDLPTADPVTPGAFVQIGKQSSRGIELAASLRPLASLELNANAALLRARFDTAVNFVGGVGAVAAGSTPANVPRRVFNAGLRWTPMAPVTVGLDAQHVSQRQAQLANTIQLPAYTLADLWLRWRYGRSADLTARLRNVTDRLAATWASSGFGQVNVIYGDPRRAELSWRQRF